MSIIEAIRTFVLLCPFLKDGIINVDFLGDQPTEYTIDGVPTAEVVRKYADGGTLKRYTFIFASREYYGENALKNIENNNFYEDFSKWLEKQNNEGILPLLDNGRTSQKIEALTPGYLFDSSTNNARYQIQCRLTYYEGGC